MASGQPLPGAPNGLSQEQLMQLQHHLPHVMFHQTGDPFLPDNLSTSPRAIVLASTPNSHARLLDPVISIIRRLEDALFLNQERRNGFGVNSLDGRLIIQILENIIFQICQRYDAATITTSQQMQGRNCELANHYDVIVLSLRDAQTMIDEQLPQVHSVWARTFLVSQAKPYLARQQFEFEQASAYNQRSLGAQTAPSLPSAPPPTVTTPIPGPLPVVCPPLVPTPFPCSPAFPNSIFGGGALQPPVVNLQALQQDNLGVHPSQHVFGNSFMHAPPGPGSDPSRMGSNRGTGMARQHQQQQPPPQYSKRR